MKKTEEDNKKLVLEAFETLFNKRGLCGGRTLLVTSLYSAQQSY
jgi:hypothetical protein